MLLSFQVKDALGGIEEKQVEVLYYKKDGKISCITLYLCGCTSCTCAEREGGLVVW